MDQEQLLSHFEKRYVSRWDMLTRLPLGVNADALWLQLLGRRKAKAISLPISDSRGIPCWYCITDKMVEASEKIVETLLSQDAEQSAAPEFTTVSTLEEVFFTSYVEGSRLTLGEAMDFLQSECAPRDPEEQLIANNRLAGSFAAQNLYRPVDEEFLRNLTFILMEGIDDNGGRYRVENAVEIPYMKGEAYSLPDAPLIPEHVRELCGFLAETGIHPLIKSAAAQAWALMVRPFPDGNERLGRILSAVLLLRAGYSFFNEISLSALIARHGQAYYEAMANIMRKEHDGDLTYFLEYYLQLLSHAVDERARRIRQRDQERLEAETELARQPLRDPSPQPAEVPPSVHPVNYSEQEPQSKTAQAEAADAEAPPGAIVDVPFFPVEDDDEVLTEASTGYIRNALLRYEANAGISSLRDAAVHLLEFLDRGFYQFTAAQFRQDTEITMITAHKLISDLKRLRVIYIFDHGPMNTEIYRFCFPRSMSVAPQVISEELENPEEAAETEAAVLESADLPERETTEAAANAAKISIARVQDELFRQVNGSSVRMKAGCRLLLDFMAEGIECFTAEDIEQRGGFTAKQASNLVLHLREKKLIESTNRNQNRMMLYQLNTSLPALTAEDYSDAVTDLICQLRGPSASKKDRRIGDTLLACLPKGIITAAEYRNQEDPEKFGSDMLLPERMGLVEKLAAGVYRIKRDLIPGLPALSKKQKLFLTALYLHFRSSPFTRESVMLALNSSKTTTCNALHQFALMGILDCADEAGFVYRLLVNPTEHPALFDEDAIRSVQAEISSTNQPETVPSEEAPHNQMPQASDAVQNDGGSKFERYSKEYTDLLDQLARSSTSFRDKRVAENLHRCLVKGTLLRSDYEAWGHTVNMWLSDTALAVQLGLIRKVSEDEYILNHALSPELPELRPTQKKTVTAIYEAFGDQLFSSDMIVATLNYTPSYTYASLHKLTLLRILGQKNTAEGSQYRLLVNPEDHPECFITAA